MAIIFDSEQSERQVELPFGPNFTINWLWFKWLIPLAVVLWLLSGIYIVRPDEQGVVRRFGRAVRVTQPGPHYHLPLPIEWINKVKVKQVLILIQYIQITIQISRKIVMVNMYKIALQS